MTAEGQIDSLLNAQETDAAVGDKVITAVDFVHQMEGLEKEALETLPGKCDTCTYEKGYVRQPVYACLTCTLNDQDTSAGFCYSCSIMCHGEHQVIELFSKRHFRCDCGNSKFEYACTLAPQKDALNVENRYGHNFKGRYCWCDTFYDAEKDDGTSFQCVVCEDWFHDRCIFNQSVSEMESDSFEEFVCRTCVDRLSWILDYSQKLYLIKCEREPINIPSADADNAQIMVDDIGVGDPIVQQETVYHKTSANQVSDKAKRDRNAEDNGEAGEGTAFLIKKQKANEDNDTKAPLMKNQMVTEICKRPPMSAAVQLNRYAYSMFSLEPLPSLLCTCDNCNEIYRKDQVTFLAVKEETIEPEKDDRPATLYEAGLLEFSKLDRATMLSSLANYASFREEMKQFLAPFADQQKIVTRQDVEQFFEEKLKHQS